MASAESITFGALRALVSDRVYPDVAPAGAVRPYIVYQGVGGQDASSLGGLCVLQNRRMQIVVWADSRSACSALEMPILQAMTAAPVLGVPVGAPTPDYDDDTKFYGSRIDVSIWFTP